MKLAGPSKKSLLIQQTIWHHIPEKSNLYLELIDMLARRVQHISANVVEPSKFFVNYEIYSKLLHLQNITILELKI
jgi:hypothetical protein